MPAKAKIIPRIRLESLYLRQGLSTDVIGKIFKCNHVTVLNYLKKYRIPRRTKLGNRKPVNIPRKVLIGLYLKQKMTQKQIAKKFGHSNWGIQRWMKIYGIKGRSYYESHKVSQKYDFGGNLVEKAYLIGFRLGDLNVYRVKNLIQARCSSTLPNQISLIRNLFKKYGHVHVWKAKRGTLEIVVLLNNSFSFLLPKEDKIEKWILVNTKYFLSFLAGYSDAEGSYYLRKSCYKNAVHPGSVFEISTYDKTLLFFVSQKLKKLGVENKYNLSRKAGKIDKRGVINNKNVWKIIITKKQSLWNFIKLIKAYHRHKSKLEACKKVEQNIITRNFTPRYQKIIL